VDSLQLAELEVRGPMLAGERLHSAVHGVRLMLGLSNDPRAVARTIYIIIATSLVRMSLDRNLGIMRLEAEVDVLLGSGVKDWTFSNLASR
jgi:hypothetical protein